MHAPARVMCSAGTRTRRTQTSALRASHVCACVRARRPRAQARARAASYRLSGVRINQQIYSDRGAVCIPLTIGARADRG
eukprot:2728094-Lingulodinium_polyedra.AAC.1